MSELGIQEAEFIPISARTQNNLAKLEKLIAKKLPENPFFYEEDDLTDKTIVF